MDLMLAVSQVGLWLVVGFLTVVVVALTRQIGLIHRRIAPAGARILMDGPAIGDVAPMFETLDVGGRPMTLAHRNRMTMLLFVSPTCGTCQQLIPALRSIQRSERRYLDVMLFSLSADEAMNREYAAKQQLTDLPFAASAREVVIAYTVTTAPYAVLIGADGRVKSKGLVNHLEHVETLLTAARLEQPTQEIDSSRAAGVLSAGSEQAIRM